MNDQGEVKTFSQLKTLQIQPCVSTERNTVRAPTRVSEPHVTPVRNSGNPAGQTTDNPHQGQYHHRIRRDASQALQRTNFVITYGVVLVHH